MVGQCLANFILLNYLLLQVFFWILYTSGLFILVHALLRNHIAIGWLVGSNPPNEIEVEENTAVAGNQKEGTELQCSASSAENEGEGNSIRDQAIE